MSVPTPPIPYLAVFKLFVSVQHVPFQDSVSPVAAVEYPPKPKADVDVPAPPNEFLAVLKSLTSAQHVPFQVSALVTLGVPALPENTIDAVVDPDLELSN